MTRARLPRPDRDGDGEPMGLAPVAVEIAGDDGRVDFHFPVEIHMEESREPLDLQRIAEHVYERLARRLRDDA